MNARLLSAMIGVGAVVPVLAQTPPSSLVQNGRVETKAASSIDREVAAVGTNADPVWIAWREPMVDGEHNMCSSWFSDRYGYVRGDMLEGNENGSQPPKIAAPTGPVNLEGGTNIIVLLRIVNGQIERMRSL